MDGEPQHLEVSSEEALAAIQKYFEDKTSVAELAMQESGTPGTGLLDYATQLSGLLRGKQDEVNGKLLNWHRRTHQDVEPQLYPLVRTYLLSAGLIVES